MIRHLRVAALLLFLLVIAALPQTALAFENDGNVLYTMYDAKGQLVTTRAGQMFVGDEYISSENRLYRVVAVDDASQTATAEFVGISSADAESQAAFSALAESAKKNESDGKKLICMYSTHSDESYTPSDGEHSLWENAGIYDVGNALKEELEAHGIDVVYSEETFLPHDADAYNRSRSTAEELLKKAPDALLDLHRDAIPAEQYETTVEGEDISKVRLFVGRSNQNREANEAFAKEIKNAADDKYPGLVKDIYIGKGNYNQELYPRALLLELGTDKISKEKVIDSTKYIADVLNDVLFGDTAHAAGTADTETRPAISGIGWLIGLAVIAAGIYALVSTGSFGGMWNKLKRNASEVSGGLFGKKPK